MRTQKCAPGLPGQVFERAGKKRAPKNARPGVLSQGLGHTGQLGPMMGQRETNRCPSQTKPGNEKHASGDCRHSDPSKAIITTQNS